MKTLLLTGATGMVGSAIQDHFAGAGWEVVAAVPPQEIDTSPALAAVPFDLTADVWTAEFSAAVSRASLIIHAAAILPSHIDERSEGARQRLFTANVAGTARLLEAAAQHSVAQVIQIGTTYDTDGVPAHYYKLSKWVAEKLAGTITQDTNTHVCTLRITAPYGPNWRVPAVIPLFLQKALNGQDLELWGDGSREQTFTFTGDIARACELAFEAKAEGVFTIAGPRPVTMRELAEAVLAAVPGSGSRIVVTGEPDPQAGAKRRISFADAEHAFGFRPMVELKDGLKKTLQAMKQNVQV